MAGGEGGAGGDGRRQVAGQDGQLVEMPRRHGPTAGEREVE